MKNNIVILASGTGTNFENIAKETLDNGSLNHCQITALICNKKDALVLEKAKKLKIPTFLIESKLYWNDKKFNREEYEKAVRNVLEKLNPDLICLAGYMLVLGTHLIEKWQNKILNIHPSLLPKYKGLHALSQALFNKEKKTGCTVHLVIQELDSGPILIQKEIPILENDTEETLRNRLLPLEHEAYIEGIKIFFSQSNSNSNSKSKSCL